MRTLESESWRREKAHARETSSAVSDSFEVGLARNAESGRVEGFAAGAACCTCERMQRASSDVPRDGNWTPPTRTLKLFLHRLGRGKSLSGQKVSHDKMAALHMPGERKWTGYEQVRPPAFQADAMSVTTTFFALTPFFWTFKPSWTFPSRR